MKPEAVGQNQFLESTGADQLRHTKIVVLREDNKARKVVTRNLGPLLLTPFHMVRLSGATHDSIKSPGKP